MSYDGFGDILRDQKLTENLASLRYRLPINGGQRGLRRRQEAKTTSAQTLLLAHAGEVGIAPAPVRPVRRGHDPRHRSTLVTLGLRRQYASDKVEILSGMDQPSDRGNHLTAWQLGVRQDIGAGFGAYAKVGRSFRVANADELVPVKSPLAPQTSTDKELGLTWKSDKSSARLSWFRYDLRNEIQYNPLGDIWGRAPAATSTSTRRAARASSWKDTMP